MHGGGIRSSASDLHSLEGRNNMDRVWLCVLAGGLTLAGSIEAMAEGNTAAAESSPAQVSGSGADFKFSPVSLGAVQEPESQPEAVPELHEKHDWRAAVTLWIWT